MFEGDSVSSTALGSGGRALASPGCTLGPECLYLSGEPSTGASEGDQAAPDSTPAPRRVEPAPLFFGQSLLRTSCSSLEGKSCGEAMVENTLCCNIPSTWSIALQKGDF